MRALALVFPVLLLAAATALPARAESCRIAPTLALDISGSVDPAEYRLQVEGLAEALEDAQVREAMLAVPGAYVALQIFEWSGKSDQRIIQDWRAVRSATDLARIAEALRTHPRHFRDGPTGLGAALEFARRQLDRAPACPLRKIDMSGDGRSNDGSPPQLLHYRQDFGDITVNGLAILSDVADLEFYYRQFVMRGPGAFVEVAADFAAFPAAMKRKLIKELDVPQLGLLMQPVAR